MATNQHRLTVNKKLILVNDAILLVQLALEDSPTPAEKMELDEDLGDLKMMKQALTARRTEIINGQIGAIPTVSSAALGTLTEMINEVEKANLEGATVTARMALANQAIGIVLALGV